MIAVNGVEISRAEIDREAGAYGEGDAGAQAAARALAVRELLRQRAKELDLCDVSSGDEDAWLDAVLEREVRVPEADDAECRRYYEQHPQEFTSGELVEAAHILFAVTDRVPLAALRRNAESALHEARRAPDSFARLARELSNCPSSAEGGSLGQFGRGEMVPEFDAEVFGTADTGVLPRLVKTRFGFHVVLVSRRIPGRLIPFDAVRERIAGHLRDRSQAAALRQYIHVLAGRATLHGVDLGGVASPLVR